MNYKTITSIKWKRINENRIYRYMAADLNHRILLTQLQSRKEQMEQIMKKLQEEKVDELEEPAQSAEEVTEQKEEAPAQKEQRMQT